MKFTIDKLLDTEDQFDISKFMEYSSEAESYDVFNSKFLELINTLEAAGEYTCTAADLIAPDAIAYNLYSDENLFWILMLYNNLSCYQKIRQGTRLKFPDYASIERAFFSLG